MIAGHVVAIAIEQVVLAGGERVAAAFQDQFVLAGRKRTERGREHDGVTRRAEEQRASHRLAGAVEHMQIDEENEIGVVGGTLNEDAQWSTLNRTYAFNIALAPANTVPVATAA